MIVYIVWGNLFMSILALGFDMSCIGQAPKPRWVTGFNIVIHLICITLYAIALYFEYAK